MMDRRYMNWTEGEDLELYGLEHLDPCEGTKQRYFISSIPILSASFSN